MSRKTQGYDTRRAITANGSCTCFDSPEDSPKFTFSQGQQSTNIQMEMQKKLPVTEYESLYSICRCRISCRQNFNPNANWAESELKQENVLFLCESVSFIFPLYIFRMKIFPSIHYCCENRDCGGKFILSRFDNRTAFLERSHWMKFPLIFLYISILYFITPQRKRLTTKKEQISLRLSDDAPTLSTLRSE